MTRKLVLANVTANAIGVQWPGWNRAVIEYGACV